MHSAGLCSDVLNSLYSSWHALLWTASLCVSACIQLFEVSSANEWKTISVRDVFAEGDEEVLVKCSTWTADGKRIICAARNAALVSGLEALVWRGIFICWTQRRDAVSLFAVACFYCVGDCWMCDKEGVSGLNVDPSQIKKSASQGSLHPLCPCCQCIIWLKETGERGCLSFCLPQSLKSVCPGCKWPPLPRASWALQNQSVLCVISLPASSTSSFVPVLGNNPNTAEMSELVSLAFRRKKNLTFNVTSLIWVLNFRHKITLFFLYSAAHDTYRSISRLNLTCSWFWYWYQCLQWILCMNILS